MKLRTKLALVTAGPLLIGTLLLYAGVQFSLSRQTNERLERLRVEEETAVAGQLKTVVDLAIQQANDGLRLGLPDDEVLRRMMMLRSGNIYLFVLQFNPANPAISGMVLAHGTSQTLVGKDLSQLHDLNSFSKIYHNGSIYPKGAPEVQRIQGSFFIQEMAKGAAKSGDAVVRYYWSKPKTGGGVTEEGYLKLGYAKLMPGKNWLIGTGEYADYIDKKVQLTSDAARADARNVLLVVIGLVGAILVVNLIAVVIVTSRIAAPISHTVRQLHVFSGEVNETANQLSAASQNLAEGATEQAASLQEISASLTELSSRTDGNAQSARESKELTDKTQVQATKGGKVMADMVNVIGGIKDSSDRTAKIVKSIDELAFQTNLLALNAAVEAARAGDSGSGFAVVAEEVRNLAQRSATAAQETARLIEESQGKANLGVSVAKDLGTVLNDINESVQVLSGLVAQVAVSSAEQAEGMSQVSAAVAQIDTVTQRTAAHAEESASAGEELRRQASEVSTIIRNLTQVIGESNGANGNGAVAIPAITASQTRLPTRLS